jgi:hypothetical protein
VPSLLVALLAAGCTADPALLDVEALPSEVESSRSGTAGFPTVTNCEPLAQRQSFLGTDAWSAGGYRYWTYHLESGDHVTASVLAFDDDDAVATALEQLRDAITECAAVTTGTTQVTPLDDLPEGVSGYRASQRFDDTTQEGAQLFGAAEGSRIVTVSAARTDGTAPMVDLVDLLEAAQGRAPDLDDLPSREDDDG